MSAELLLAQFDSEVATRCELIRTNADAVAENLRSAMELTLIGIPECVRKMPLRVLMESFNGDIQEAAAHFSPAVLIQLGPGTQLGKSFRARREPATPPPKGSPRAKVAAKQAGVASENAAARICDSPGERSHPAHPKSPAKLPGRSPKKI
jgi:hypothetical protein